MAIRARLISLRGNSLTFQVRLTPKGGRDAIEGWSQGADGRSYLKARVRVAPEDGKANAALLALLAKELDIAKSAFALVSGETSRLKTIAVTGDTARIAVRLEQFGEA
jgi:uncharacterized protein YggU (UPF0235/DUF167 family)